MRSLVVVTTILLFVPISVLSADRAIADQELHSGNETVKAWLGQGPTPAPPIPVNGDECRRPPNDYRRRTINGETVNGRTMWMLQLASRIYKGPGSPLRVVQGSYTDDLDASFGTHAGGGVVDISIRAKQAPHDVVSMDEAYKLVRALRLAGFAAWLRLPNDLDPPTALHIHAVAVGDQQLSDPARRQLYGPEGYFQGYDGVPPEHGGPHLDRLSGPTVCAWMVEDGVDRE